MTERARTIFLGSGQFGVEVLRRLAIHPRVELVGAVTAPPRPAGRGRRLTPTAVDEVAGNLGVPTILRPARLRAPEALSAVAALQPTLAVLADYGQIVPPAILELHHGALNLHPSLLPRHRGASPIAATIMAGDSRTGVTLMRMDEGLDSGPILAQREVALDGSETAPELEQRLAHLAADVLADQLEAWLDGRTAARPQPAAGVTMTRPLRRTDGRLDPTQPVLVLERQVRAYQPWPGSYVDTDLGRLVVWRARVAVDGAQPLGTLVARRALEGGADGLALVTADGLLDLVEVQPAGGRRMTSVELLRGRPRLAGSTVSQPPPAG